MIRPLSSILEFKNGKKRPAEEGRFPVYGGNGILGYADDSNYHDCIAIGRVGAYCGSVYYERGSCWISDNAIAALPKADTDVIYAYYLLKSLKLNERRIGTSQPLLTQGILNKTTTNILPAEQQKKVGAFLYRFDQAIKQNEDIKENLLQQARVLFRQRLLDTPSAMCKLSDIADINPETYSLKDGWSYVNYLDTSSITAGTITEVQCLQLPEDKLPSRARRILRKGDVVFSTVRPNQLHYGIIANPMPNMLGSTGFVVIRSKKSNIPNEIIYLAITEPSFIEQMQQLAEQSVSTFPSIRPADLDACVIPELQEGEDDYVTYIKSIFESIAVNDEENKRLSALRDSLIPRLMSGEINVPSAVF